MVAPRSGMFNGFVGKAGHRFGEAVRSFAAPWEFALFLCLPLVLLAVVFASDLRWSSSLGDWQIFRAAARSVIHGHSPYVAVDPASLSQNDKFVYPPVTALLVAPLAVLPVELGRVLVLLLAVACVLVALRLLGVSDWRCYGLALLTAPVVDTVSLGALSTVLLVGVAAAWRYRDHPVVGAVAVAGTAVAKLFLWPLGLWLVATRRWRSLLWAAALGGAMLVGGWAVIGFAGLSSYPHLLRVLSQVEAVQSYSLAGLFRVTGGGAVALSLALAGLVAGGVILAARGRDGDRRALAVAVTGSVLAAPVLWLHYFVLLLVPLALFRSRLSALWFAPLAFWVTPLAHSDGSVWRTAFALAVAATTAGLATLQPSGGWLSRRLLSWLGSPPPRQPRLSDA
jgi:alpha-1,2-mannosyltransferase